MSNDPAQSGDAGVTRPWWETRPFVAVLILLSMVPLIYPENPPLVDLFGHMGRYRVQLELHSSQWLRQYYDFRWAPIGNLGVDLLVIPLSKIFGLELAVKLIVLATPPMTVAGFLWVAREVHHRLPPTVLFALPIAYSHPFLFGFTNFALSMALAFLAFGLWLRLGRLGRLKLRAALFVPISIALFFVHTFGWGTLGLMAFSAEAVRQHDSGVRWLKAGFFAALHAASMALPFLFMLAWRADTGGGMTLDWFNWASKWSWVEMILRDRWKEYDRLSLLAPFFVLAFASLSPLLRFSRNLAFSALVLGAMYLLLPRVVFGSAYADMRLVPYVVAIALLAIRFREETHMRTAQVLAGLGLLFYLMRLAGTTISLTMAAQDQEAKLEALEHVPMGARVANFVGQGCVDFWAMPRNSHLGAMVMVRKQGFSNDQWQIAGSNLLTVRYSEPGVYRSDPSEIVRPNWCRRGGVWKVDNALRYLPRHAFDYVWLMDVPDYDPSLMKGMDVVWRGPGSVLYRVNP